MTTFGSVFYVVLALLWAGPLLVYVTQKGRPAPSFTEKEQRRLTKAERILRNGSVLLLVWYFSKTTSYLQFTGGLPPNTPIYVLTLSAAVVGWLTARILRGFRDQASR
jgi:hypothetical protein